MGAFGLNASIMDSANVAWKIGLCARNLAQLSTLGPTYDQERRLHANCIIRVSGSYLRFVCNSEFPLASFDKATSNLANLHQVSVLAYYGLDRLPIRTLNQYIPAPSCCRGVTSLS